jgi:S1-C subfamily serine protease
MTERSSRKLTTMSRPTPPHSNPPRHRPTLPKVGSLALAAIAVSCATPGREVRFAAIAPLPIVSGKVVTELDMLQSGRRLVDDYIAALPEPERDRIRGVIARGSAATVRVHARVATGAMSFTEASGTGVLTAGSDGTPVVATAGHTFTNAGPAAAVGVSIRGGRELAGTLLACVHDAERDFAIVQCSGASLLHGVNVPRAAPRRGSLVVAIGYPHNCGVDEGGHLTLLGPSVLPAPLVLLAEVVQTEPLVVAPTAGAAPLGGFSGGGFFDLDGNLIGVLTATSKQWDVGADALTLRVLGCAVTAMHSIP